MKPIVYWVAVIGLAVTAQAGTLHLGAEELVQANGANLLVIGYSVPSFTFWNDDALPDLVVGEGSGTAPGKVRVYLNVGVLDHPAFSSYFYAQSLTADLVVTGNGCMGACPRVVYWDADARKDLLVGLADGTVRIYLNTNTEADPRFDGGTLLQVGQPTKVTLDVGSRATPTLVDWNNDGLRDLVSGGIDGKIHVFINHGTDTAPDYWADSIAQGPSGDLIVPSTRSCPTIADFSGDGRKDLLTGNTDGQILLYVNTGTDAAPVFAGGYTLVTAASVPIDLAGTPRSRQDVCFWDGNGLPDMLVGSGDGLVRLYRGRPRAGDMNCDDVVDFDDIRPFVLALTSPAIYAERYPSCMYLVADMDGDGDVDFDDIRPFVQALGS